MLFQDIGNHSFKVAVEEQIYLSLIVYGQTTLRRKLDSHHDDNQALASHAKRGRRNRRSFSKALKDKKTSAAPSHEQRKDISRIQCFRCDKYGHIARNCHNRKKARQYASSTIDVDSEPHQRDEDIKDEAFFFISQLSQEGQKQD